MELNEIEDTLNFLEGVDNRRAPRRTSDISLFFMVNGPDLTWAKDRARLDPMARLVNLSSFGVAIETRCLFHLGDLFGFGAENAGRLFAAEVKVVHVHKADKHGFWIYGCSLLHLIKPDVIKKTL